MTKREIIEAMANYNDDDVIVIIREKIDRDGYPYHTKETFDKIRKDTDEPFYRFGNPFYN